MSENAVPRRTWSHMRNYHKQKGAWKPTTAYTRTAHGKLMTIVCLLVAVVG